MKKNTTLTGLAGLASIALVNMVAIAAISMVSPSNLNAFDQSPERFGSECFMGLDISCAIAASGYLKRYEAGEDKKESLVLAKKCLKRGCELKDKESCAKLEELEKSAKKDVNVKH